jgi:hypothetical protein
LFDLIEHEFIVGFNADGVGVIPGEFLCERPDFGGERGGVREALAVLRQPFGDGQTAVHVRTRV